MGPRAQPALIRFRARAEQKATLEQIADERNVPLTGVLRDAVTAITGVPDTLRRCSVRRDDYRSN
jgi:hypothetical protein